ncbi:MAG: hypothetical protein Ct9H300mP25_10890 [Acidobacteriota bacterium]|nr:MAG: hypothetical protein Ct9H300mP25_10890 [Acidobacteriota bacterium]
MSVLAFVVTTDPLDLSTIMVHGEKPAKRSAGQCGGGSFFYRQGFRNENQGHQVDHLEYEAYKTPCGKSFPKDRR